MMTTDEQIIAAAGEPFGHVGKDILGRWNLYLAGDGWKDESAIYIADAILAAAKPLRERISELEANASTMKAYYEQVFKEGEKRIVELTKQRDDLADELETLKGLSHDT